MMVMWEVFETNGDHFDVIGRDASYDLPASEVIRLLESTVRDEDEIICLGFQVDPTLDARGMVEEVRILIEEQTGEPV